VSADAVERAGIPEFIFGDQLLHARFATAIELIANTVLSYPRSITSARLSEVLGRPVRTLTPILRALRQAGLIEQAEAAPDAWFCGTSLGRITLADVFCSVAEVPEATPRRRTEPDVDTRSGAQQSVDLLLMQATMAINQVVFQRLQGFDLERLRALNGSRSFESVYTRTRLRDRGHA
jgi:DNA-binding IscR family transcriptional regulator